MSIDIDTARNGYESAKMALDSITGDITAPKDVRDEAAAKREILIDNYLDDIKTNIEERTQQYIDFIAELEAVIDKAGKDSPVEGVKKLQEIVGVAADVVKSVQGENPGVG